MAIIIKVANSTEVIFQYQVATASTKREQVESMFRDILSESIFSRSRWLNTMVQAMTHLVITDADKVVIDNLTVTKEF